MLTSRHIVRRLPLLAAIGLILVSPGLVHFGQGPITPDVISAKVVLRSELDLAVFQATLGHPAVHANISSALAGGNVCWEFSFYPLAAGRSTGAVYITSTRFGNAGPSAVDVLYVHAGHFPSLSGDRVKVLRGPVLPSSGLHPFITNEEEFDYLHEVMSSTDPQVQHAFRGALTGQGIKGISLRTRPALTGTGYLLTVFDEQNGSLTQAFQIYGEFNWGIRQFGPLQVMP